MNVPFTVEGFDSAHCQDSIISLADRSMIANADNVIDYVA
jgi:hypothetical protein